MHHRHTPLALLWALLTAFLFAACGGEEPAACDTSADCDDTSICGSDGFCREVSAASCSDDDDCPGGFVCEASSCVRDSNQSPDNQNQNQSPDNQNNQSPDNQNNQSPDNQNQNQNNQNNQNQNNQSPDNQTDPNRPKVESFHPPDGSTDVSPDVVIRATFDTPLNPFSVTANSFFLQSPEGHHIPGNLEYLADEREVVFTPDQPLWAGSKFTIRVRALITDETLAFAAVEDQATFSTGHTYDEDLLDAIHEFAPVVYQEMRVTDEPAGLNGDMPTRVDFDGDHQANNNSASAATAGTEVPAHVYYSAISTETHYFLHYTLYYTTRRVTADEVHTYHDHDFAALQVVVDRSTGEAVLFEGVRTAHGSASDTTLTFRPNTSAVQGRTDFHRDRIRTFDVSQLKDGNRFPLYIPSGIHAGCSWYERNLSWGPTLCPNFPEAFLGGHGVVLYPGDTAQTYSEAEVGESGHLEMTYELIPFTDPFWTDRGDLNCGLFSSLGFTYDPWESGDTPPLTGPPGFSLFLPRSLCSSTSSSYGVLPFRWFSTASTGGEWFMDSPRELNGRLNFNTTFSLDYCENLYFDIDRRDDAACGGNGD